MRASRFGARAWVWQQCLYCGHPTTYFNSGGRRFCGQACEHRREEIRAAA